MVYINDIGLLDVVCIIDVFFVFNDFIDFLG